MVMSPVALGAQAERQKQELDVFILSTELNKPQTFEQFWNKNKAIMHGQIYETAANYVRKNPQGQMPVIKTVQTRNSLGETINNIEMTFNNKIVSFQFIGDQKRFLKYKSVYLSEADVINFDQALTKMIKVDPDLAKDFSLNFKSSKQEIKEARNRNASRLYSGLPQISQQTWAKMSRVDRAHYILNMRAYWTDSLKVLRQIEKNEQRLHGIKSKTSRYEYFMQFFQNEAWAQNSSQTQTPPVVPSGSSSSSLKNKFSKIQTPLPWGSSSSSQASDVGLDSEGYLKVDMPVFSDTGTSQKSGQLTSSKTPGHANCVIFGLISEYVGGSCTKNIQTLKKFYSASSDKEIFNAIQSCESIKPTHMACNPYLYGYKTPGQPHCVEYSEKSNSSYQKATHADGPCETVSPLGNALALENLNGTDFLNKDIRGPGRYSTENLKMSQEQLAELYKKQQLENDQYVTNYLKSFLGENVDKIKKGFDLDDKLIDKLVNIQNVFNSQIKFARESCEKSTDNPKYKQYDQNFWQACDQLHRRHLFVGQWLEKRIGCEDGGKMDDKSLMCMCPPSQTNLVIPGQKCSVLKPVIAGGSSSVTSPLIQQTVDCEAPNQYPKSGAIANSDGVCLCTNGKEPHKIPNPDNGDEYSCAAGGLPEINWKPFLWIGGGLLALWGLTSFKTKKKAVLPAPDVCKVAVNCTPQCPANQYLNPAANNGKGECWPKSEGGTGLNVTDVNSGGVPTSGGSTSQ